VGIAAVGAAFFARLADSRGDFASAFQRGILIALAFIVASLVLACIDIAVNSRKRGDDADGNRSGGRTSGSSGRNYVGRHEAGAR
jgi:hypothetical protein